MNNNFTLFKRALLCCSFGCFATLNADAQHSISCKFSSDFDSEMQKENILEDGFDFKLSTTAEALDSIETRYFTYSAGNTFYFRTKEDMSQLTGDSIKVYYSLYSGHVIVEKGEVMAAIADLKGEGSGNVIVNPLPGTKKMIAKCPIGIDGKPMSAAACFITKHKDGTSSCHSGFGTIDYFPSKALILEATPEGKNNAPFWIKSDLDYAYVVAPHTAVDTPQYLLTMQNVNGESYPDTLTCDYSKAKKVTVAIKQTDGNYANLEKYLIFNKITNTGGHMDFQPNSFELRQILQYNKMDGHQNIEFYALPGKHYLALDGRNTGQEGIITVNEHEAEQRVELDYANYFTLHKKGKAPFGKCTIICRNKETGNTLNKAEEKLVINSYSYYIRKANVNGEEVLHIWPGFGYETIDIELDGGTYKYEVKNLDLKNEKDYTFDMSDLYEMKINVPTRLLDHGYICANGINYPSLIDKNEYGLWHHKDFDEQSQRTAFFSKGQHQLDVKYEIGNNYYDKEQIDLYSKIVNLPEDANKEINLGWENSATYSVNTEEIAPSSINTPEGIYIDSLQTGTNAQLLYIYKAPGEASYHVDGPQEGYVPLEGKINVGEKRPNVALTFTDYKELKIMYGRNQGPEMKNGPIWYSEDGEKIPFSWHKVQGQAMVICFAKPGRIYMPMACGKASGPIAPCTFFPIEYDFNDTDSLTLTDTICSVLFSRGEEGLTYENYGSYKTSMTNETLDADVHIYALNFPNAQKEMLLRVHKGRKRTGATLFPGFYRAEDKSGNKVYFEVKPEDKDITIDFANPPVPPVGIEEVLNEGNLPAAYYDMSGRQLNAPQKGINIVRMQNGKVKKIIMK